MHSLGKNPEASFPLNVKNRGVFLDKAERQGKVIVNSWQKCIFDGQIRNLHFIYALFSIKTGFFLNKNRVLVKQQGKTDFFQ